MNIYDSVSKLPLIGPAYSKRLKKLEIKTIEDLLHHVPNRYLDFRKIEKIKNVRPEQTVTVKGIVTFIRNQFTHRGRNITISTVQDDTSSIKAIWFNQPYLISTIKKGAEISIAGKVDWFGREKAFVSPEYELSTKGIHTARLVPIYPETMRLSSKWLRSKIQTAFNLLEDKIEDYIPEKDLGNLDLPDLKSSIKYIHFPSDLIQAKIGTRRLAFDELLFLQIKSLERKLHWEKNRVTKSITVQQNTFTNFISSLPFELTQSQKRSIEEIFKDLEKNFPMNRLLEGDVGSGKTVVAAASAFACFLNGFKSVFMAPTQILAQQHYETLRKLFDPFKIRVQLVTSSGIVGDSGTPDIYIGTHALIHQKIDFEKVALVVIDEQHRFGVEQRAHLIKISGNKRSAPHVLTMTATPIPRTVALSFYGDLSLSTLEELPKGRIPISTWIVPPEKRTNAYRWIEEQIKKEKIQVYVICPLIEKSEVLQEVKAATAEFEHISKIFPRRKIGLLHGKLSNEEKNKILDKFKKGSIDILVSTPVIEVGIDVANATIMLIEAADRFGLAQLHQLRGRVGRGSKKSYCMLFTESKSMKVTKRLSALKKHLSGFELAELDLSIRGPGEVFGLRQHGYPELKIASWKDINLIKQSKEYAEKVITKRARYKKLFKKMERVSIAYN